MKKIAYVFLFLVVVGLAFVGTSDTAHATLPEEVTPNQVSVEFYTKHELVVILTGVSGGQTRFPFKDSNQWDDTEEYKRGGSCNSQINMDDKNSTTARFRYEYPADNGSGTITCQSAEIDIAIPSINSAPDGFRIDEDTIFVPYMGSAPNGCSRDTYGKKLSNVRFSKREQGTPGSNENIYFGFLDGSSTIPEDEVVTDTSVPNGVDGFFFNDEKDEIAMQGTCGGVDNNDKWIHDIGIGSLQDLQNLPERYIEGLSAAGITYNPDTGEITTNNPTEEEDDNSCESAGGIAWILCGLLKPLGGFVNWVESQITALLQMDRDDYANDGLRSATGVVRTIALSLLVPIMLVMVISTALGFDFISAYTVKTALPRMFIAVIFIALSFDLMVFTVDVVQAVGDGVQNILLGPFNGAPYNLDAQTSLEDVLSRGSGASNAQGVALAAAGYGTAGYFIGTAVASAAAGSALLSFLLGIIGVVALTLFIIFLLLTFRQMVVIILIIISPLAILPWIFPGRDKLFSLWSKTFFLMLWFYPVIMMAVAAGKIMAVVLMQR